MPEFQVSDGYDQWGIEAGTFEEAVAAVKDYTAEDLDIESDSTVWVHLRVVNHLAADDGDIDYENVTLDFDPVVPDCTTGEHSWVAPHEVVGGFSSNPGVWGKGGGIVSEDFCEKCATRRTTDSWAQDPETGQQGLDSVKYRDPSPETRQWVEDKASVNT